MNKKIYLGLVINQLEGRYQKQIISGVNQWSLKAGIGIIIISGKSLNSPFPSEDKYNSIYKTTGAPILSGLIIAAGSIGSYQDPNYTADFFKIDTNVPIITLGIQLNNYPCISGNNKIGIKQAIEHLIVEHKHKKIAFLRGPESSKDATERFSAYVEAMNDYNYEIDHDLIYDGSFTFYSAAVVTKVIIEKGHIPFDSIICANDEMALGLMNSLSKIGYESPRDYSVIGFDDIEEARFTSPTLTTISQSLYFQAQKCVEFLLDIINGKEIEIKTETESKLIIRESCGCTNYKLKDKLESYPIELHGEILHIFHTLLRTLELDIRVRREDPIFLQILDESLEISMKWENYTKVWFDTLELIEKSVPNHLLVNILDTTYVNNIFVRGFSILSKRNGQREAIKYNKIEGILFRFRSITDRIIPSIPKNKLWDIIQEEIMCLDIKFLYIALNINDETKDSNYKKLKPSFLYNKKRITFVDESYPAENIFPSFVTQDDLPMGVIIQPLIKHDNLFGLIAIERGDMEYLVYDTLTDIISQVLYTSEFYKQRVATETKLKDEIKSSNRRLKSNNLYLNNNPLIIVETTPELLITNISSSMLFNNGASYTGKILKVEFKEDNKNFTSEKLTELNHFRTIDIPKVNIGLPSQDHFYPVLRYSVGKEDDNSGRCTSILWYILDPKLPFENEILPSREFYEVYNITDREKEILALLLYGKRSKDISEQLFIAESTVKGHIGQIYSKFEVKGRHELFELIQEFKLSKDGKNYYLLSIINNLLQ